MFKSRYLLSLFLLFLTTVAYSQNKLEYTYRIEVDSIPPMYVMVLDTIGNFMSDSNTVEIHLMNNHTEPLIGCYIQISDEKGNKYNIGSDEKGVVIYKTVSSQISVRAAYSGYTTLTINSLQLKHHSILSIYLGDKKQFFNLHCGKKLSNSELLKASNEIKRDLKTGHLKSCNCYLMHEI